MAQSHNENETDRNLNCPGIRLDCGSLPKCYTTRNIMRPRPQRRSLMYSAACLQEWSVVIVMDSLLELLLH